MVLEGVTVIDPAVAPPVEKPVPVQEVAFVELHVSVEDWPAVMDVGLAEREAVGRGLAGLAMLGVTATIMLASAHFLNRPTILLIISPEISPESLNCHQAIFWIRLGDVIRTGFLSPDERADLIALARDGSAVS